MRQYFEKMKDLGKALRQSQIDGMKENVARASEIMKEIDAEIDRIKTSVGVSTEKIHKRGQMTVWQRLEYLVEPGTLCPLHSLYNPLQNEEGTTDVIDGTGRNLRQVGRHHRFRQQGDGRAPGSPDRRKTFCA